MLNIASEEQHQLAWSRLDTLINQDTLTKEETAELHKLAEACLTYINKRMEDYFSRYERS